MRVNAEGHKKGGGVRIGIDESSLISKKTGIGSFAYSFLPVLKSETGHEFFSYRPDSREDLRTLQRIWWESVELPRKARQDSVDIVYSPGFSTPPRGRFKKVVTVHDLIGLIYPNNVGAAARFYWSHWLPYNVRRADALVASSESTRRDIEKYLRIPASSVQVVPLAASSIFSFDRNATQIEEALKRYGLKNPYLLAVGTLEPRKNSLRLLKAFHHISKEIPDLQLTFVGKDGGMEQELKSYIHENELNDRVKLLGYVPDEALARLYNGALGYVMISLYEGFGLPALEAMSCGLTGVVSNRSSLPEVVGETAWKADPENINEIAGALKQLFSDEGKRNEMAEAAYQRSKNYSYARTAKQMIEIFKKTLS